MKAINRRTGQELKVRKFRNEEYRGGRKTTRWTRAGSLRSINEQYAAEREDNDGE
jgi:hypothetical protein